MPVRGDFKELADLGRRLAGIASSSFKRDLFANLAEEARTQVVFGFEQSRDPYGATWAPITTRSGQPLRDTGRLLNSYHARANASGFEISTNVGYAATHQYGATIRAKKGGRLTFRVGGARGRNAWVSKREVTIRQRQQVPERDLGPIWHRALGRVADDFLRTGVGR